MDKVPVHPEKHHPINAQDPGNWIRGDIAESWAKYLGEPFGYGIVLWKGCGLFCIDVDKALVNGEWTPLARSLITRFDGAYQEVSQSGKALHIFASYHNEMPPHKKKNTPLHLEMYDELRFIAVTGTHARGDETFDATNLLPKLISEYFPPGSEASGGGWTTEPAPEWDGPEDDDELLRRAFARASPQAIFGNKASFHDLFMNKVERLSVAFPSQQVGKPYDGSSVDLAFFNELAFWTGGNCERMARIANRSELKRDKWDRESYLEPTIVNAAAYQKTFYKQRRDASTPAAQAPRASGPTVPVPKPPSSPAPAQEVQPSAEYVAPPTPTGPPVAPSPLTAHGSILTGSAQIELFTGCVYVQDINQIMVSEGHTLKRETFENDRRYRGRTFITSADGQHSSDSAWEAFTQSKLVEFDMVRGTFFDPMSPEGQRTLRAGLEYANTWKDPKVHAQEGDVSPYVAHINKLFPQGDDAIIYLSFVAACVQYQGFKAAWALFVQGTPGNGKSFLTGVMRYCLGEDYVHSASASNLDNRFNGYLYRKLLILVEEIKTIEGNASLWEKLKTLISDKKQEIEAKGVDQVTREVCFNMIFNSNHRDGIRKTDDDRRICPLFSAQQCKEDLVRDGMNEHYFINLWSWFNEGGNANVLHFLKTFPIPAKYDFTKEAIRAPITTSTNEAVAAGLSSAEQDVVEAISADRTGFKGGWINSLSLDKLLNESGRAKFMPANKRKDMLVSLGYVPHPALPEGRLSNPLTDNTRPRLYVLKNHSSSAITKQGLLRQMYEAAQKS